MAVAHMSLAVTVSSVGLYLSVIFIGLSFGSSYTLHVVVISELWGLKHFGANYLFSNGLNGAVGALGIAKFATQTVYTANIREDDTVCYGRECFGTTHWIVAGSCACGTICSAVLLWRTRALYRRILYRANSASVC